MLPTLLDLYLIIKLQFTREKAISTALPKFCVLKLFLVISREKPYALAIEVFCDFISHKGVPQAAVVSVQFQCTDHPQ